jgi:hypothetical protein
MRTIAGVGLAALLLGVAPAAMAGPFFTETQSYGPANPNWGPVTLDFNGATPTAGDHLTEVVVTVTEALAGTAQAVNNSTTASGTGTIQITNKGTATIPTLGSPVTVTDTASSPTFTVPAGQTTPVPPNAYQLSNTSNVVNDIFSGLGTFETAWTSSVSDSSVTATLFSGGLVSPVTTDTGTVTVQADYFETPNTTVPEPMTAAVLSSGLLSLALVRYRRSR